MGIQHPIYPSNCARLTCSNPPCSVARQSLVVIAGNKGSTGPFAPIVVVVRNAMGMKEFNQFRGKAISLHSQGEQGSWKSAALAAPSENRPACATGERLRHPPPPRRLTAAPPPRLQ